MSTIRPQLFVILSEDVAPARRSNSAVEGPRVPRSQSEAWLGIRDTLLDAMLSPELETLDQLLGGDLSLKIIRTFFPDDEQFTQGLKGLLSCGDVSMISSDGTTIPDSQWRQLLTRTTVPQNLTTLKLRITAQGTNRIT